MTEAPPAINARIEARSQAALAALDAELQSLMDEQLLAPSTVGEWSLRDVLAHLSAGWLAAQVEAHLDGRVPTAIECFGTDEPPGPHHDLSTQDGRNAWQHERDAHLTLAEVRARFARYRSPMDVLLGRLTDDDLAAMYVLDPRGHVGRLRPANEGESGVVAPLWRWIQGNTWHHYEAHLEDVRAAQS